MPFFTYGSFTMLHHHVYFWLKPEYKTAAHKAQFEAGLSSLLTIGSLSDGSWGTPAPTDPRPVIDHSYDFGLYTLFTDVAAHDAYQIDPVHDAFLGQFKTWWEQVKVYDFTIHASR